jgi:hypothetical protein
MNLPLFDRNSAMDDMVMPLCSSREELRHLVETKVGTIIALITPEIAGWLLELNTHNRRFQPRVAARYQGVR